MYEMIFQLLNGAPEERSYMTEIDMYNDYII